MHVRAADSSGQEYSLVLIQIIARCRFDRSLRVAEGLECRMELAI